MKKIVLSREGIVIGAGSLEYLKTVCFQKAFIVTGGHSMLASGVIARARDYLMEAGCKSVVYSGICKNPTMEEVEAGLSVMRVEKPDVVIAIGGGSAMDAAKAMLLFYDFPMLNFENVLEKNLAGLIPANRSTGLICVASTSGTGSEVTRGTVITDPKRELKMPIMTDCLRPDIAILDAELAMTMPAVVAAETGMDALTHAMEAYTNHNLDDFDEVICKGAIVGILNNLEESCLKPSLAAREKIHHYQAMAGIGFANVGLGMVHGIAHSFGAVYNMAHGLTNAVILPYALEYNRRDPVVKEKLEELSYHCRCTDIVARIWELRKTLGIPDSFSEAGMTETDFLEKRELLIAHAMLGATKVNPVDMTTESMEKMVDAVYYGRKMED